MPVFAESSCSSSTAAAAAEQIKVRRPRNQVITAEADLTPEIQSSLQSTRCKSTISSIFHSTFSNPTDTLSTNANSNPTNPFKKKANNFTQSTFRGLGCTAAGSQQVSVPAVIRTSADWDAKKVKKKTSKQQQEKSKKKKKSSKIGNEIQQSADLNDGHGINGNNSGLSSGVMQDVWCGPGIGFSADAVGSVDCVVSRRNVSGRGRIDGEKLPHRERSCLPRRTVNPETLSFLDSDSAFVSSRPEPDFFGSKYYRHVRHPSPEGLAEMMLLHNSFLMGRRLESHDQFSDWRLDIDDMSYEELLELGDRIGYVNTGLKDDEITKCLRKMKHPIPSNLSSNVHVHVDRKCTICQEEFEANDEMGKLYCGHSFHTLCIKQWLGQKKTCPVCKTEVVARR